MAYSKARFDLDATSTTTSEFPKLAGLNNVGFSVYVLGRGEGFEYFHSHREQEEVYFCIEGSADVIVAGEDPRALQPERITLHRGDLLKVEPRTLRAMGNVSSDRAVLVIAGGCPHPYPAGHGHDVIADVFQVAGEGETGFRMPPALASSTPPNGDDNC